MEKIGEIIKKWRYENNLTGEEVAEKVGVSQQFLNGIENNKKKLSKKVFDRLIELMNPKYRKELEHHFYIKDIPQSVLNDLGVKELGNAKRIKTVKIPMYGTASAGPGYLNLSIETEDFLIPEEDYMSGRFAVKVEGNSMTGPGKSIPCGSIALVDPNMCTDIEELIKKICVFTYNDETYIKQLIIDNQNIIHLVSFNPEISDIIVLNHKDLKCEGRVVKTYFEQKW